MIQSSHNSRSGAALLTVLVAMMVISIMLFEFQYAVMVEQRLSHNDLHHLQAYYLAKAGARLGLIRVALYGRTSQNEALRQKLQALPGLAQYLDKIWNLPLPAFPPVASQLSQLDLTQKNAAEAVVESTKIEEGSYTHVITDESGKINLNHLEVEPRLRNQRITFTGEAQGKFHYAAVMLLNLLERFIRDSEDPYEEFGNIKPEEIVFDIMDWINPGSNRFLGGPKDSFYEQQKPPYKAKRARFYTVEELRLVKGIEHNLFQKLKPHVTVYSHDGKVNLNTTSNNVLRAILPDFSDDDIRRINEEKLRLGGSWSSEEQFVKFVDETLRRTELKKIYRKKEDYPFAVDSKSFLVESLGSIKRGATEIQKTIRVAVAFAGPRPGTQDPTLTDQTKCEKPGTGRFWHKTAQRCLVKSRDDTECRDIPGGQPYQDKGKACCQLANSFGFCFEQGDGQTLSRASQVRILNWIET